MIADGSERAHNVIDNLEEKLSDAEATASEVAERAAEQMDKITQEAQAKASGSIQAIEDFVREKPLQAAGLAFAAGILTAVVLRRN